MTKRQDIEGLLARYFEGRLDETDRQRVEKWKDASAENARIFEEAKNVAGKLKLLRDMQRFDAQHALAQVNRKIGSYRKFADFRQWRKIAAALLIPAAAAAMFIWFTPKEADAPVAYSEPVTTTTRAGMQSHLSLPDGTRVWLNSDSELIYPAQFAGPHRVVSLRGEAFFDVAHDKSRPFIVKAGNINVEVVGTRFNVINYEHENQTEVILESGKVNIFSGEVDKKVYRATLEPGERAVYEKSVENISKDAVETEKYTTWKEGKLVFRGDKMEDVAKKLNRWFNVRIELADEELKNYEYTATFEDETLYQILDLLKISAPIEYVVSSKTGGKQEIVITKKENM